MKCWVCHRNIKPGLESQKRVEEHLVSDEPVQFGEGQPGGPLDKAEGPLVRAWHSKCFHAGRKRTLRGGDAVLGTRPEFAALLDSPDGLSDQKEAPAGEDQ
jgi:hypothetical protein